MSLMRHRQLLRSCMIGAAAGVLLAAAPLVRAAGPPRAVMQSFAFPMSLAHGVMGDLVAPAGSATHFSFEEGRVAIGDLPVPLPLAGRSGRRLRSLPGREFVHPPDDMPHGRLLLYSVVTSDGAAVTNTGNQLVIDAVVSPSSAATDAPPFVIQFDINNGTAFVDAPLPIQNRADGSVRLQILGVTVIDPDGQPFGVLGFELPPARPTATPHATPTAGGTPPAGGQCFTGPHCTGVSFQSSQEKCCHFGAAPTSNVPFATSWCAADQFDPASGKCADDACVTCVPPPPPDSCANRKECSGPCKVQCPDGQVQVGSCQDDAQCRCSADCTPPPTPTPVPDPCSGQNACAGSCTRSCPDGTAVSGTCLEAANGCACSAACGAPTPCGVGQCFDTITLRCTGLPCGPNLNCPLPNQLCDLGGRRCPCQPKPSPPPHGHICCQCDSAAQKCFDISFVEVQAICPPGCETLSGQECDEQTGACAPPPTCATDADCDDGNGCTVDRCTPNGCSHDCVCVGPMACHPGPAGKPHHPH